MISECEKSCGFRTRTGSPASAPQPSSGASLATPRHASCPCSAAEKNNLWRVRPIPARPLRQQAAVGPRPVLWRHPCLPGVRGSPRPVSPVWCRETGEAPLAGGQSLLHQTLCLLRRPPLPQLGDSRRGARTAPRLEDRQTHLLHFGPHSNASPLVFPRFRGDCRHSGRAAWCHVCLIISRYCPVFLLCPARSPLHSMVSRLDGRSHVLPRQTCRTTPVLADRGKPLGRRPLPPTRCRHPRAARSPPARRPTRKPPRLRRPLRPAGAPAQRPSQGHPAHAQRPTTRRRPHLRTPLAR